MKTMVYIQSKEIKINCLNSFTKIRHQIQLKPPYVITLNGIKITLWKVHYLHVYVLYLTLGITMTLGQSDHIKQLPLYFYVFTKKLDTMSKQNENISAKQIYILKKLKETALTFQPKNFKVFLTKGWNIFSHFLL